MFKKNILIILFVAVEISISCFNKSTFTTPKLPDRYTYKHQIGYVNDFSNILTLEEENKLEKIFTDYDNETTNEIGVITVNSISNFSDIVEFTDAILTNWRFGKDNQFNGLLIVIHEKKRQVAIRFGKGIQEKLTDEETQRILDEITLPEFKNKKYFQGIVKTFSELEKKIK